jgi:hypothetical protein
VLTRWTGAPPDFSYGRAAKQVFVVLEQILKFAPTKFVIADSK